MMRSILLIPFSISLVLIFNSCRKGDEDPFFTLQSRKSRLAQEWELVSSSYERNTNSLGNVSAEKRTFENGSESRTIISSNGENENETVNFTETISFKKNGTYVFRHNEYQNDKVIEGEWHFLKKSKAEGIKNKECIALFPQRITDSDGVYVQDGIVLPEQVISLIRLADGEMKWQINEARYTEGFSETINSTYTWN